MNWFVEAIWKFEVYDRSTYTFCLGGFALVEVELVAGNKTYMPVKRLRVLVLLWSKEQCCYTVSVSSESAFTY